MKTYIGCLLFTAAAIAAFPLTVRSNDNASRTTDNPTIGSRNVHVLPDRVSSAKDGGTGIHNTTRMRVSAYCACKICCGQFAGISVASGQRRTASGHRITGSSYGRICAAPTKYPFGTKFDLGGGRAVVCEDRGGSIKAAGDTVAGKVLTHDRLDILMEDHQTALEWGVKYLEVKVVEP